MHHRYKTVVYTLSPDFNLPDTVSIEGKLSSRSAGNLPFITDPDGRPSFYGNMFMLSLYDSNYSIEDGGGTLREYANQLAHIIRFTHDSQISFLDMTDSRFWNFRNWIRARRDSNNRKTGIPRTNRILRFTLEFLNFIGLEVGLPEFVSANGAIRSEKILKPSTRRASGKPTYIRVWDHACILEDDGSTKQGYAIGTETLAKLESEIDRISSRFIMRRSQVMVELFKYTAGRRAEVGNIRVPDIRKALDCDSPEPMLTLSSRKGERGAKREIPVPRHVLEDALEFVETERKSLLKEMGLPQAQAPLLFISVRTGKPLSVKYISTQFWNLKKKAKISEKAHAHMLRHLAISKRFEQRANNLIGATTSPLITIDVIIDSISLELMQFSGHTSKQSLDVYAKLEKQKILKRVLEDARLPPQKSLSEINILNKLLIEISNMRPDEIEDFLKAKRDELLQEGPESNRP